MEMYEIIVMNLNTKEERVLPIEVDEAEENEYIVIKAVLLGEEISVSDYNYLPAYQEFRDKLLELGRQAMLKDIVHIWDNANIKEFPNTEQQKEFFEQWSKSLMR